MSQAGTAVMTRMTAATMAVMTKATPAHRAGETSCPSFLFEPRLEDARRVVELDLAEAMRRRPGAEWLTELNRLGIPCGPINTLDKVFSDPQGFL